MATAISFKSPDLLLNYINSITLPATWEVFDEGARIVVVSENTGTYFVNTFYSLTDFSAFLGSTANTIIDVVPKKEGNYFMFWSVSDPAAGTNTYNLSIAYDGGSLESILNTETVLRTIENGSKKIVIHS